MCVLAAVWTATGAAWLMRWCCTPLDTRCITLPAAGRQIPQHAHITANVRTANHFCFTHREAAETRLQNSLNNADSSKKDFSVLQLCQNLMQTS